MKRTPPRSRRTQDVVDVLGLAIAQARRERRWSVANLAERANVSEGTVRQVERGSTTVAIGTVVELAHLVGLDLLATDDRDLKTMRNAFAHNLSLLPARIRQPSSTPDDDF